jgi:hypothetical protein
VVGGLWWSPTVNFHIRELLWRNRYFQIFFNTGVLWT